ncbi:corrinoid ABC transporter substrate-binding protein [Methyloligella halotolerans]|uniref:Corrinoid ABC transporter substrate-binding protein n=1 Tax=Methyloligella halotolerans TaxID=1177755 RepID=A0A1E2RXB4_9HYPH|nr:ABC transporter substrate-binding protein [Methyloligella halotolerans]ODA66738.1 corrinoid ABC transporter substrate-binding protein [Methyloligella halotolerans]
MTARPIERWTRFAFLALSLSIAAPSDAAEPSAKDAGKPPPHRIVSLNVCTDQLLMLLVPEERIAAVSHLARDPEVSTLSEQAAGLPITFGSAEQLIVAKPDLILAGAYTRANVPLLRQLGFKVVEVPPATSLKEVVSNIRAVGEAVGESERAEAMVRDIDEALAEHAPQAGEDPLVVPLYANAYTSGPGTLVDSVLQEAGLLSIGRSLGLSGMQKLNLETVLMSKPDALLLPDHRYEGDALAYDVFRHPALQALHRDIPSLSWDSAETICGTPEIVHVVKRLRAFREELVTSKSREAAAAP